MTDHLPGEEHTTRLLLKAAVLRMTLAAHDREPPAFAAAAEQVLTLTGPAVQLRESVTELMALAGGWVRVAQDHTNDNSPTVGQALDQVGLMIARLVPEAHRAAAAEALPPLVREAIPGPIDWLRVFAAPAGPAQVHALAVFAGWLGTEPDLYAFDGSVRHGLTVDIADAEDLAQGGPGWTERPGPSGVEVDHLLRSAGISPLPAELGGVAGLNLEKLVKSHLIEHPERSPAADERLRGLVELSVGRSRL
ncbi:hypothetical protein [Crossiella sp. CA198]|uniref:hypothetical protein n=1 Tax=Crossiella sp. CA198 TaxID=3455607 RepID=UPI003F8D8199